MNGMRIVAGAVLAMVLAGGAVTSAQNNPYRNYTEEKFVQNMQAADRNYAAVKTFIAKADYESAKAQLTRAREQMALTITFWRDVKKNDAVAMLRQALSSLDALDATMSADKVDGSAVAAASDRINAACQSCHTVYREQDPATKAYRVRRFAQ